MLDRERSMLAGLLVMYTCASLVHFTHNAEFLGDYPNLPDFLTRSGIYVAWLGVTAVGLVGFTLYRLGWRLTGLVVIAGYAVLGFDGLLHYARAPLSAHTTTMNSTIWFEVVSASALLFGVALALVQRGYRQGEWRAP